MHPIGAGVGWDGCYEVLQWETFGKAAFTFCAQLYFHLARWVAFLGMCPVPIFCPFGVRASPKASGAPARPLLKLCSSFWLRPCSSFKETALFFF